MEYEEVKYSTKNEICDALKDIKESYDDDILVYREENRNSRFGVLFSKERLDEVLDVLKHSRAKIVAKIIRNERDMFFLVYSGRSENGKVYSSGMKVIDESEHTNLSDKLEENGFKPLDIY